jgi:hypothetical protein
VRVVAGSNVAVAARINASALESKKARGEVFNFTPRRFRVR